jgi:hypothetical protein
MTSPSREHLLGYLLQALAPHEQEQVEAEIEHNPALAVELRRLESALGRVGLQDPPERIDPPLGLARRTCRLVAEHAAGGLVTPASVLAPQAAPRERRFTWYDLVTVAAVLIAALSLAFPALSYSRFHSQIASCQNQLRLIGLGLHGYSNLQPDHSFPGPEMVGPRAVVGVVAPILVSHHLAEPPMFLCSTSPLASGGDFRMPSLDELDQLTGLELRHVQRAMGGDFGYNMGYVEEGRLMRPRDARRPNYVLVGDAPSDSQPRRISKNHDGRGQNVLYEDGRIQFLRELVTPQLFDDPYHNRQGWVAAGVDSDDAVLGASADVPLPLGLNEVNR